MEGVALQFAACTDRFEGAGNVDVEFEFFAGETQTRLWAIRENGRRLVSISKLRDDAKGDAVGMTGVFVSTPPDGQILAQIVEWIGAGLALAGLFGGISAGFLLPLVISSTSLCFQTGWTSLRSMEIWSARLVEARFGVWVSI